ncbi:hypothetical protein CSB08_01215 [Candidatus Gracilibacteria bacterium]|nr:MAG: hypothetical protein CSB08_01215 [Candidatus Gracilibacteria bacterium]PIE85410.1 MAG: hypothetical protein CSA08_02430 [Candidatus Gracilibacteria bacterium]
MEEHLGYKKHSVAGNNSGNSRNGTYKKRILTSSGEEEIEVPRDRDGSFEPRILPKYETRTNDMEDKIITTG